MVTAYYGQKWGQILRRELLPQFLINFHESRHRCSSEDINVQDTYFVIGKNCVAMETAHIMYGYKVLLRERGY